MNVLKITVTGLPLFADKIEFDFFAQQRVSLEARESLHHLFSNHYQNNVLSVIGINASGKTTLLKVIAFALRLLKNEPINTIDSLEIFSGLEEDGHVTFDLFFYADDNTVNKLQTVLYRRENRLIIGEEQLFSKPAASVKNKKNLLDFSSLPASLTRDREEEFLLDDVSIIVAFNKSRAQRMTVTDMLRYTNNNLLPLRGDIPPELIAFFDPSIEYLHYSTTEKEAVICLKFRGKEEILLQHALELNRYLSSGTIKGIHIFMQSMNLFESGGYLIIDEMENHLNKEIISTLIRFYMDKTINTKGAVLVFSTHYAELLDEFSANDNIYIVRNRAGITVDNLATLLTRNDIKKSDAYQSSLLDGTAPPYESYIQLKNTFKRV